MIRGEGRSGELEESETGDKIGVRGKRRAMDYVGKRYREQGCTASLASSVSG